MKALFSQVLFFFTLLSYAEQDGANAIHFINEQPVIDGNLSEPVWEKIEAFTDFHNYFPIDEGLAENQTEVKVFHNQQYLFVGVVYHDSDSKNNISSLKRDIYYDAMFVSDCFGIILDPYNEGNNGYFFGVNASGVQFDALVGNINNINESWSAIWQSKVSKQGKDKYYEIAIPLNAINFNPQKNEWGVQFYTNNTKQNQFTTWAKSARNYNPYDLRFTKKTSIDSLPNKVSRKFSVVPSITFNHANNKILNTKKSRFIPSIDGQYNINSSLRLDLTVNPDFSQVEVDQQVTNLTRFAINFPERRKFFLENSDLFTNLGTYWSDPFYSRRIGAETDILFGAKISGNIGDKTRIGLLNTQTKDEEVTKGKNYSVLVGRHSLSNAFNTTLFFINSQQKGNYNRVAGADINFKSGNNKWLSKLNYAKAFANEVADENNFFNAELVYQTKKLYWTGSYQKANKNYVPELGFIPFLYNFDAVSGQTTREGFSIIETEFEMRHFPEKSKRIDWLRRILIENRSILNKDNSLRQNNLFVSPFSIRFKDRSYVYISFTSTFENLNYNFDFLQNGKVITPGKYNYTFGRVGFWSQTNKKTYYTIKLEYGQFYKGLRKNAAFTLVHRLLPIAALSASYEINGVDLHELGVKTFHLAKLTTEIYLNNRLNWTTYLQYNTQQNNFNINSRVQWEYQPLSYVYLVLSNNYDNELSVKNWGLSFKINKRFDF